MNFRVTSMKTGAARSTRAMAGTWVCACVPMVLSRVGGASIEVGLQTEGARFWAAVFGSVNDLPIDQGEGVWAADGACASSYCPCSRRGEDKAKYRQICCRLVSAATDH
jgi:hypothetical protein